MLGEEGGGGGGIGNGSYNSPLYVTVLSLLYPLQVVNTWKIRAVEDLLLLDSLTLDRSS